jgi:hypothetical protein
MMCLNNRCFQTHFYGQLLLAELKILTLGSMRLGSERTTNWAAREKSFKTIAIEYVYYIM